MVIFNQMVFFFIFAKRRNIFSKDFLMAHFEAKYATLTFGRKRPIFIMSKTFKNLPKKPMDK